MKILFINSKSPDYVEDQLFAGLTEVLGKSAVTAYPVNYRYYFERKPYPLNMGLCHTKTEYVFDFITLGNKIRNYEFDYVVIGSTKRDTFENYLKISNALPTSIPVVFVDGGDFPEIGGDADRLKFRSLFDQVKNIRPFKHVFKRECLTGKEYPKNTYPFPMAFKPQQIKLPVEKQYDVTCWCVESDPIRTRALMILENLYDCRSNGTTLGQTFRNYKRKGLGYLRELGASRISCNFRGVGWDTLRYWEIPGVMSLMITQQPKIEIPSNFIDGEHVIFCKDDLSDLTDKINYYLKNDSEREALVRNGYYYLMENHTYLSRAKLFLEKIST